MNISVKLSSNVCIAQISNLNLAPKTNKLNKLVSAYHQGLSEAIRMLFILKHSAEDMKESVVLRETSLGDSDMPPHFLGFWRGRRGCRIT